MTYLGTWSVGDLQHRSGKICRESADCDIRREDGTLCGRQHFQSSENFEDRSYARVFGIVLNHRNVENETEKVETFAKEHGFDIVGEIPRSDEIIRCEDQGKTVIEGNPESDISKCFYDLAEILWKDEEQV